MRSDKSRICCLVVLVVSILLVIPLALLLVVPLVSAQSSSLSSSSQCQQKVIYYGTCDPDGDLEVYNDNVLLASQTSGFFSGCYNGIYVVDLGPAGALG